jgi:hypothetical protein
MLLDKDIREPLFDFLEIEYGKTRIIEEKMIGKSRADVIMVITNALVGIEIKSDADTYARLEGQIKDYEKYFDYNIVVVGSSHASHVPEHVPDSWGIITVDEVDGKTDFYFFRRPLLNPKVKLDKKLELLWRPELGTILERLELPAYKSQSKPFVRKKLLEKVEPDILNFQISELLFERDYEKLLAEIAAFRKAKNPRKRAPKKSTSVRRVRRLSKKS